MSVTDLLWEQDAIGQAEAIRSGQVGPSELVEAAIEAVTAADATLNAVSDALFDRARTQAQTAQGPFAGVPTVWKDLGISVRGQATSSGSRMPARTPQHNSRLVEMWQEAGLVCVAMSTTSEWGLRIITETDRCGITRNPWNRAHMTGGSSGGSAALVAAGAVPVAHASDGGGSIRIPAACCGLIGLKPSRGRVPMTPDMREGWNGMVVQHAVTRSVRDSAALLDVVTARPDPLAPYAPLQPGGSFRSAVDQRPKGLKIGIFTRNPLGKDISADTQKAMDLAATACRDAGHSVTQIDIPAINRDMITDFCMTVAANHAGNMELEAARSGRPALARAGRQARILRRFGTALSGAAVTSAAMRLQHRSMDILRQSAGYDVVLTPLLSTPPLPCGGLDATGFDAVTEALLDRLRLSFLLKMPGFLSQMIDKSLWFAPWPCAQNITGQPAIALPVHVTSDGLPMGVQAVGRTGEEALLLALAAQLEADMGWQTRRAPKPQPG